MRYDALLLDADNTLLDFSRAEREAFTATCAHFSLPPRADRCARYSAVNERYWKLLEQKQITRDRLVVRRFEELFAEEGLSVDAAAFDRFYREQLGNYAFCIEGARELLQALYPLLPLYVVTNGVASIQYRRLKDSGLLPYLRRVFVSEELGADKPSPAFFEPVLHEVGAERSRLLICGDSPSSDIRGGRLCGIDTCLFDPSERYPDTDSTYTIRTLAALLPIVTG